MINEFKLEEYLAKYEFSAPYLLCCSDAESWSMHEIISMASENDFKLWNDLKLNYTEDQGLPELREIIAKLDFPNLDKNNILCFAGAEEGIFCALSAVLSKDDHAIVLTPCYQSLAEVPKFRGAEVTEIELLEENNWQIDIEAIKNAIKQNTKILIINFPHNPTGQVISPNEQKELVTLLRKHNLWLFSDEVYRLIGKPIDGWAETAANAYEKAISLGVMSKAYGMPGLRIGWIASQSKEILDKARKIKHYTTICNSSPAEIICLIALNNRDQILDRNNQIIESNIKLLDSFFEKNQNIFSWIRPQGGCVGFVNYLGKNHIDDFCNELVTKQGVLLLPASAYSYNSQHFRVGFGRKNMPIALEKLEQFI
ncbi:MAG: aminotransferase class I/II-fold pyridoxal phosphate-dependent enzyme [Pseudomonadota bacterium]